jgi:histidine triad (HIT) family protein
MDDCIFCKIASGEIPAKVVYRDDAVLAIEDLNPQAPAHLLVIPAAHYASIVEAVDDGALAGSMMAVAARLGKERGGDGGFRLIVNTGPDGGQTVAHVHVHVLAGRAMTWPPG